MQIFIIRQRYRSHVILWSLALMLSGSVVAHAQESVWMTKSKGELSCSPESGVPLDQAAEQLESAGVEVLEKKETSDGKMHIQMCGAETGKLHAVRVSKQSIEKAKSLGFELHNDELGNNKKKKEAQ